jgi:O-antigen/teichoic acid export membrane protein
MRQKTTLGRFANITSGWRSGLRRVGPFYLVKPAAVVVNFITISVVTQAIGIDGYGAVTLIVSASALVATVLDFRVNEALVKFRVRYLSENRHEEANFSVVLGVIVDSMLAGLYLAAIVASAAFICGTLLQGKISEESFILYGASAAVMFLGGTPSGILQSENHFVKLYLADLGHKVVRLLAVAFVSTGENPAVDAIIAAYVSANVLFTLALAGLALPRVAAGPLRFRVAWSARMAKEFLSFSGHTFVSSLIKVGINDMDKLILGYYSAVQDVGAYDIVKRLAGLLLWVGAPLGPVAYPAFVGYFHKRRFGEMIRLVAVLTPLVMGVSVLAGAAIGYGHEYLAAWFNLTAVPVMSILVPLLVQNTLLNGVWFSRALANSMGEPQVSIYFNLAMALLTVTMLLALVPEGHGPGAALATLVAAIVTFCLWISYFALKVRTWQKGADL